MNKYKMVVFDIDGTLVPHLTNSFSEETNLMFKKLKENNFIISLATGRDWISISELYKNEHIDYFIGANGSFIYDLKNNKNIFNSSINWNEFEQYKKDILDHNEESIKSIILSEPRSVFVKEIIKDRKKPWFWDAFKSKFSKYEDAWEKLDKNNFHLLTIEHKYQSDLMNKSKEYFDSKNFKINVQAFWPKGFFVANKGVTKSHSIQKLCKYLSIDMNEVIAFGDGENDLEMIRDVGLGIAMGNSVDKLKEIADDVTQNVEENGTKFYLEKMGII